MFPSNESKRGAFLEHVREAREERMAERLRDVAAVKIQAHIRGWLVRESEKKKIRNEFDEIFGLESTLLPDLKNIPHATIVFKKAVRLFKIFERDKDCKRYLLSSMDSDDLKISYVCCAMNKALTLQWIQHIKEVAVRACEELEFLHVEVASENRLVSLYLHLLLIFSATTTWRLLQQEHLQPLRPALNKLTQNIMAELVTKGIYHTLQQVLIKGLCRGKPAIRGPAITTIITLSLRPFLASEQSHNILSLMAIHIFSVPALIHHLVTLAPDGLRMFHSNKIFEKILEFVYEEQNLRIVFNTLEGCYALCLLANLVHLAYLERETSLPELAFPTFSYVVNQLLNKCGEYVSTKQSRLTQWHPLLGWFSQSLDQHLNDALPLVRTQLELLWSTPILRVMFQCLSDVVSKASVAAVNKSSNLNKTESLPPSALSVRPKSFFKKALEGTWSNPMSSEASSLGYNGSKTVLKLGSPEVTKVCHICSLYYMTTSTLSQLKMDILTGICHRSDVLRSLWVVLLSLGPNCGLKTFLNLLSVTTKTSAPEFQFLILFFDATTHLVSVLDDMEMYEQQKPFTIEDFKILSNFLNHLTYKMLKNNLVDIRNVGGCPLFSSAHTLLKLLLKRNARRPFVADNHWYISEMNVLGLMGELEKGKKLAQVLIQKIPHILSHEDRVLLFRNFITKEKISLGVLDNSSGTTINPTIIAVRREALVEDGYRQLASLSPTALKGVIRVRFINQQGLDEAGIDQDGVFKEFLEETLKKVFDPSLNLFRLTNEERLFPSPTSSLTEDHLQLLEFTGKMLGKAVYEGILVDCPFASFFLSQLIGEQHSVLYSFIDELPSLDSELYKNLTYVKHYEGDVSDLDLTFSYDEDYLGQVKTHELRPGGRGICLTNENKILYIHLMAHFKLHTQIKDQTRAFVKGFRALVQQDWLSLFSVPELQRLISGDNVELDLQDLRQHTHYYGGFHDKHRVICWLWDILKNDFSEHEKRLFLKFVTSCSKPPLLGFSNLEPPFSIRCVEVTDDEDTGDTIGSVLRGFFAIRKKDPVNRLPTSSTCFNLLKLPNYQKRSNLKEKLRYAIHSNTGFELS
ncbi:Ubiquitin-protein ligase E3B [Armadillidium vulgare]|nr:Ubiquitin-protein ligase E3B [Armadillidium vulgare]